MSTKNRSSRARIPLANPAGKSEGTMLLEETKSMERARRLAEQEGHRRRFGRVNERDHSLEDAPTAGLMDDFQNQAEAHPWFVDSQNLDGVDISITNLAANDPELLRKLQNALNELQLKKQNRLENLPQYSSAPRLTRGS